MDYVTLHKKVILEITQILKYFQKGEEKKKVIFTWERQLINVEGIIKTENRYFTANTVPTVLVMRFRQEPHLDAWMKKALGERFGGKDVQSLKDHLIKKLLITKVRGCFTMKEASRNYHNQVTGLSVTSNHKS